MRFESTIHIAIGDRDYLWREGLKLVLQKIRRLSVVGIAKNGTELMMLAQQESCDIIITDVQFPDIAGVEAIRQIRESNKKIRIVCFLLPEDKQLIVEVIDAGADACVAKCATKGELLEAIKQVMDGRNYYCGKTSGMLTQILSAAQRQLLVLDEVRAFNAKEIEIMRLICQECASKEIAGRLQLAHRTVEKYRERIMQKTGAQNVVGIALYAIKHDIFKIK